MGDGGQGPALAGRPTWMRSPMLVETPRKKHGHGLQALMAYVCLTARMYNTHTWTIEDSQYYQMEGVTVLDKSRNRHTVPSSSVMCRRLGLPFMTARLN